MATDNRKITIFLLFSTYSLPLLPRLGKHDLETRQSCEKDFGQCFNLKKMKKLSRGFLKIVQFHIF